VSRPREPALGTAILRLLAHRIDSWGVGLILALLALSLHDALTWRALPLAGLIVASYWLAYALNDYFDAPFDALDPAKAQGNPFVRFPPAPRRARAAFALATLALAAGFALFGVRGLAGGGLSLLVAWAYSAPPLRLKRRPGLDLLTHSLFVQTYTYFLCLLVIDAAWGPLDLLLLSVNFLASLSGQLAQQVRDFGIDSRTDGNFATRVGRRWAGWCLRTVTLLLVLLVMTGFGLRLLPLTLAPFALAFAPTAALRIGPQGAPRPTRWIAWATGASIVWAAVLAVLAIFF
jgi:hypothetical protein